MFGEALDPRRVECELWESGSRDGFRLFCEVGGVNFVCVDLCVRFCDFLVCFPRDSCKFPGMRSCDGVCGHYVV